MIVGENAVQTLVGSNPAAFHFAHAMHNKNSATVMRKIKIVISECFISSSIFCAKRYAKERKMLRYVSQSFTASFSPSPFHYIFAKIMTTRNKSRRNNRSSCDERRVDSSVAAAILAEQGYNLIGITLKTYRYEDVGGNIGNDSSCCSLDGINDARLVASQRFPHYVLDFSEVLAYRH